MIVKVWQNFKSLLTVSSGPLFLPVKSRRILPLRTRADMITFFVLYKLVSPSKGQSLTIVLNVEIISELSLKSLSASNQDRLLFINTLH